MKTPSKSVSSSPETRGGALVGASGFIALALLWCQVGYLTPGVSRALGGILWLVTVYFAAEKRRGLWLALSALLLFNPYGAVHHPFGLWLLALLPWAGGLWGRRWMGAAFLAALAGYVISDFPAWWAPLDNLVASISGKLSGTNLSATAAGLPLFALAAALPLTALFTERSPFKPLAALLALTVIQGLYIGFHLKINGWVHRTGLHGNYDAFSLQWALIILFGLVLIIWALADPPRRSQKIRRGTLSLPLLTLAGALLVGLPPSLGNPGMEKTVLFYNQGYLNWELPVYGYYGKGAAGMFGLAPEYLRWRGFNVQMVDSLSSEQLQRAGVVVIINLIDPLSDSQSEALRQFVQEGGSLLLLGDHTGLANIREPSNELLAPYGIELNFDTAKPRRTGWEGALVTPSHPLTAGVGLIRDGGESPGVTQIWVGASLKIGSGALPVILGRDGFADIGDETNEKDGYLGDYRYRFDERLGDLVLVAERSAGKGKVLVFGDTSTLQNGALVRSGPFTEKLFRYLLTPVETPSRLIKAMGLGLLLLAVVLWFLASGNLGALAFASLALAVGAGVSDHLNRTALEPFDPSAWSQEALPRALLDRSHFPRTPLNMTGGDGIWGLQNCLMRSRFLPVSMETFDPRALKDADLLIEIAPAKKFSKSERDQIADFMRGGGLLIVSCGTEEFDGAGSLLREFGLEPLYVPLGPAQVEIEATLPVIGDTTGAEVTKVLNVRFHKAWEVKSTAPDVEVVASFEGRPVAVYLPVGDGGILYLADTDFLTNRNLESPSGEFSEDNILFLRYLFRTYAKSSD